MGRFFFFFFMRVCNGRSLDFGFLHLFLCVLLTSARLDTDNAGNIRLSLGFATLIRVMMMVMMNFGD